VYSAAFPRASPLLPAAVPLAARAAALRFGSSFRFLQAQQQLAARRMGSWAGRVGLVGWLVTRGGSAQRSNKEMFGARSP